MGKELQANPNVPQSKMLIEALKLQQLLGKMRSLNISRQASLSEEKPQVERVLTSTTQLESQQCTTAMAGMVSSIVQAQCLVVKPKRNPLDGWSSRRRLTAFL